MKSLQLAYYSFVKVLILTLSVSISANAETLTRQSEGLIQEIDIANQTITISAYKYNLSPNTSILTESGSKSYLGNLNEGDKVRIKYESKNRTVNDITVLPIDRKINLK
ncbi:hypothetical protein [Alkalimarinus sediminis]|uniref:DUF5666 domain-containing protein n=1 Tax=Alkalimarinus sediminis TaxID=1632866 RepID=A0A9E8KP81_9ALTE|nr:hypothetical protein [Alkalimarinus sediminis]UZW73895.1 hypothetical protein NNL22_12755 [Alkalimarinus sediminis]